MNPFLNGNKSNLLCHFTSIETFLEHIVSSRSLKFGNIENTNDPKEFFPPSFSISYNTYNSYNYYDLIIAIYNEIQKYKLLCFATYSKEDQDKGVQVGYLNPMMWALYGNNHTGCCLIFDEEKFIEELKVLNINNKKAEWYSEPINYISLNGDKLSINIDNIDTFINSDEMKNFVKTNREYLLFTKSKRWESEDEKRYVVYSLENSEISIPINKSLIGIVYGTNCPQYYMEKCMEELSDLHIEHTKINWLNGNGSYTDVFTNYYEYKEIHLKRRLSILLFKKAKLFLPNTFFVKDSEDSIINSLCTLGKLSEKQKEYLLNIFHKIKEFNIQENIISDYYNLFHEIDDAAKLLDSIK